MYPFFPKATRRFNWRPGVRFAVLVLNLSLFGLEHSGLGYVPGQNAIDRGGSGGNQARGVPWTSQHAQKRMDTSSGNAPQRRWELDFRLLPATPGQLFIENAPAGRKMLAVR